MTGITYKTAADQDFMPLMRELVRAYQAFASCDAALHRESGSGLTVSQADVVFTLGNTGGMTCAEIGERTLITKGTLTGVIDRLAAKGLVRRRKDHPDARCTRIVLTPAGRKLFEQLFPWHVSRLKARFDRIADADRTAAIRALRELRAAFAD
jgi:MarR family 2-MHQ and catechol resistance regulon transcriptional repressor